MLSICSEGIIMVWVLQCAELAVLLCGSVLCYSYTTAKVFQEASAVRACIPEAILRLQMYTHLYAIV